MQWFRELMLAWVELLNSPWRAIPDFILPDELVQSIEIDLLQVVEAQLFRCVVDCLEQRRVAGSLSGTTPSERFDDFYRWLGSSEGCAYFASNYSGHIIQAFHQLGYRCDAWTELLVRLWADIEEISNAFVGGVNLRQRMGEVRIQMGAGDTHRHGKAVAIINVGQVRFVYKPRNLDVDRSLKWFIDHIHARTGIRVSVPSVILKEGYGWAEFVEHVEEDVKFSHYGRALGFLASIEFLASGNDFHYENVVGTIDSGLTIVDAETCVGALAIDRQTYATGSGSMIGSTKVFRSVLGTGLLPLPQVVPGREGVIEIGAAGIVKQEVKAPYKTLVVKNPGSDQMHIAFENLVHHSASNTPQPQPSVSGVVKFRDQIVAGVREGFAFAQDNKEYLCDLFTEAFTGCRFRFVNVPTQTYSQLLRMVTSPGIINDPIAHVAVLGRCEMFSNRERSAAMYEVEQMLEGDVPYFELSFDDDCLYGMAGDRLIEKFFEQAPREAICERIHRLDDATVSEQIDLCVATFARSLPVGGEISPSWGEAPECPLDIDSVVKKAAELIITRGCRSDNNAHPSTFWGPQISVEDSSQWTLGTLGYDLYGGSPGVALALSAAEHRLQEGNFGDFCASVFNPMSHQILDDIISNGDYGIGGYMGVAGTLWAIVWDRRLRGLDYGEVAQDSLQKLSQNLHENDAADLVVGQAGVLAVAVDLARMCSGKSFAVDEVMEEIVSRCLPVLDRYFRETLSESLDIDRYTGFAHGLAGILASLSAASTVLQPRSPLRNRVELVVQEMINSLCGRVEDNGAVGRSTMDNRKDAAWCHGAPGVLLGLTIAKENGFRCSRAVLDRLADYVKYRGVGNNSTACHGDLGNLRILGRYAELISDNVLLTSTQEELLNRAKALAMRGRVGYEDKYSSTDSLMLGRAGAVLTLLFALSPTEYPDFLTLGM
jgi:type 2 lantibiotic biosynthesis protein lanM